MTELQKCEYTLLKKALQILNDNNLKYFVVCGTALGAVKYQGFIPWDDDIDIALPRKDYEKFIQILEKNKDEEMVLQNYRFDSKVPFFYTKLRLNNTTFIEKTVSQMDIHHGVFIDVFPLDGHPKNKVHSLWFEVRKQVLFRVVSTVFLRESDWKNLVFYPVRKIVSSRLEFWVKKYENLVSQFDISESELMCNYGNSPFKNEYSPKWHYGNGTWATFEGLRVRVPENYDAYLTKKYGDWREELPEEQQKGHHYFEIYDSSQSYTHYTEKLSDGKIRIKKDNER